MDLTAVHGLQVPETTFTAVVAYKPFPVLYVPAAEENNLLVSPSLLLPGNPTPPSCFSAMSRFCETPCKFIQQLHGAFAGGQLDT